MTELQKSLGPIQFFSIGFGSIVGVGWIVYMGIWFQQAGPMGTAVAFLVGGLLMALVALCYAEASSMFPIAGGEAAYAYAAFGQGLAFAAGWAMVLMMTAVVPYISVSMAWILDALVPGIGGATLYTWRGQPIQAGGLAIALLYTAWLGILNFRGIQGAAKFQDWLTYGKLAISLLFVGAGVLGGKVANLEPMFQSGPNGAVTGGILAVLATVPWFLGGFNGVSQVLEERAPGTSARTLGLVLVATVLVAGLYYALAALAAGMVGPWGAIVTADLPVAAAFRLAFGSELFARIVLVAGLLGIITVGNGAFIASSRLIFALGRARLIAPVFTNLHPVYRSPTTAIGFITVFGLLGDFLGRQGIGPIVNVGAAAGSFAYLVTALAVWRLRRINPDRPRPFRLPTVAVAALASIGSVVLLISALRQHWIDAAGGFPLEWVVIVVWVAIGWVMWRTSSRHRDQLDPGEQRRIVLGGDG